MEETGTEILSGFRNQRREIKCKIRLAERETGKRESGIRLPT